MDVIFFSELTPRNNEVIFFMTFTVSSNMGMTSKYIDRYPTASMTNNPPRNSYPACHPHGLSCRQQIITISKVHNVSNVNNTRKSHRCFLPSGNSTSLVLIVSVNPSSDKRGMNPLYSINTLSYNTNNHLAKASTSIGEHARS